MKVVDLEARRPAAAVWKLRLWDDREVQLEMRRASRVGMGGEEIGDLSSRPSDEWITVALEESMPERGADAFPIFIGYWRSFLDRLQVGDYLMCPLVDRLFAIARVEGPYEFDADAQIPQLRHTRPVSWLTPPTARGHLSDPLRRAISAPGTIGAIKYVDALVEVEQLIS